MSRQKSQHQKRIEAFMEGAEQELPKVPTLPSREIRELRARLLMEEALETCEALGCTVEVHGKSAMIRCFGDGNIFGVADGCADLSVVNIGTMSACGITDVSLLKCVDENNLEKLEGDFKIVDGKLIKPKGHMPPDILAVLGEQGYDPNSQAEEEDDEEETE